jgi:hypothetical protein
VRHLGFHLLMAMLTLCMAAPVSAQNCKKGKPCGHTCIARDKICRIGPAPASPPVETPHDNPALLTVAPGDSVPTNNASWVASPRGHTYYRNANSCRGAKELKNRIYFRSEEAAIAAGYRRSVQKGC